MAQLRLFVVLALLIVAFAPPGASPICDRHTRKTTTELT